MPSSARPAATMPQASAPSARRRRRIDRRPRCVQRRRRGRRGMLSISARDHSASARSSMISPSSLLAAEPRAVIARHHRVEERRRQVAAHWRSVGGARHRGRGSAISRLISAIGRGVVVITWRGRVAEPQRRTAACRTSPRPLAIWRARRTRRRRIAARAGSPDLPPRTPARNAAVRPFEPAARRDPDRAAAPRAMHREQAGDALDHHLAHLVLGLADQRDARCRSAIAATRAHPFGAGARLAGAAPADHQPGRPRRAVGSEFGRPLVAVREHRPVGLERVTLLPAQRRHERRRLARRQKRQFFAQVRNGIRRCRQGCHRPRAPRIGSAGC